MKNKFLLILFLICLPLLNIFGQAKKPSLLIIPDDNWCHEKHFMTTYTDASGKTQGVPDYEKALVEDPDLSKVIGAMEDFMTNEGYNVKNLEGTLATLKKNATRAAMTTAGGGVASSPIDKLNKVAKADINVKLNFAKKKKGPYTYLDFNVGAYDAYTSAPVSTGNMGTGTPGSSDDLVSQLGEIVLSFKDKFITDMDTYFNRLFTNGRTVVITCLLAENCEINYETEFEGEELSTLIENWVAENSFKGNYSLNDKSENIVAFEVQIPMIDESSGTPKGTSADWFAKKLIKYIETTSGGVKCKNSLIGLGSSEILLGGK